MLFAGLVSLVGCGSGAQGAAAKGVSYSIGAGETVTVAGKTLTVSLEGNPTTGFEWSAEVTGAHLSQVDAAYVSDEEEEPTCGGGGVYNFVYEGTGAGEATVAFAYARSW